MVIAQAIHRAMWRLPARLPTGHIDMCQQGPPAPDREEIGLRGQSKAVRCVINLKAISIYVDDAAQIGSRSEVTTAQKQFVCDLTRESLQFSFPNGKSPAKSQWSR